jgi:hypothetical protein
MKVESMRDRELRLGRELEIEQAKASALLDALEGMLAAHGEEWKVVDRLNQRVRECACPHCKGARATIRAAKGESA